jgi:hypothetical protein
VPKRADLLETLTIPKRDRNPVAKRIQKIIVPLVVLVSDPKTFNLIHQVVFCPSLVFGNFMPE